MKRITARACQLLVLALFVAPALAQDADPRPVYRCPGKPVLYTDSISAKDARDRGCKTVEGAPITIVQSNRPRTAAPGASGAVPARTASVRVDPAEQRARDSDSKRILEGELSREEERLAFMRSEYKNGEPDRLGDERNYQKYIDRVADMKAAIARKENDIAAIKRELSKLPQ